MIHELKIFREYFEAVVFGDKTFEIRRNDRDYKVGDYLALNEIDGAHDGYSGRSVLARVRYMITNPEYCKEGFAVLGIELCKVSVGFHAEGKFVLGDDTV